RRAVRACGGGVRVLADRPRAAPAGTAVSGQGMNMKFDQKICGDFDAAMSREWIEANGIGGFASSTIAGVNSRRYHGLLTAATKPPLGRMVLLSKLEETLIIDGRRFDLSANQYSGAVYPRGYAYRSEFRLDA